MKPEIIYLLRSNGHISAFGNLKTLLEYVGCVGRYKTIHTGLKSTDKYSFVDGEDVLHIQRIPVTRASFKKS